MESEQAEQARQVKMVVRIVKWVAIVIVALIVIFGTIFTVGAGSVGVVTRFGAVNRVVNPGLGFKIPLVEGIAEMETRTQKEQVEAGAASSDLQDVKSVIALNYHLRGEKAVEVFQNVGVDYKIRVVDPIMQEAFKAATAQFSAENLIKQRDAVKQKVMTELSIRLGEYNIIVDNFNIVDFDFSKEFNDAIEAKQVAQQNKEKADTEAQTALAQAQGQANAQKALKDSGSLSPEYLQFLALQKWNGILPTVVGSGMPFINIPIK